MSAVRNRPRAPAKRPPRAAVAGAFGVTVRSRWLGSEGAPPPAVRGIPVRHGVGALEDPRVERPDEGAQLACALPGERAEGQLQQVPYVRRLRAAFGHAAPVGERPGKPVHGRLGDGGPAGQRTLDHTGPEPRALQPDELRLSGSGEAADPRAAAPRGGEASVLRSEAGGAPTRHEPFDGESRTAVWQASSRHAPAVVVVPRRRTRGMTAFRDVDVELLVAWKFMYVGGATGRGEGVGPGRPVAPGPAGHSRPVRVNTSTGPSAGRSSGRPGRRSRSR